MKLPISFPRYYLALSFADKWKPLVLSTDYSYLMGRFELMVIYYLREGFIGKDDETISDVAIMHFFCPRTGIHCHSLAIVEEGKVNMEKINFEL